MGPRLVRRRGQAGGAGREWATGGRGTPAAAGRRLPSLRRQPSL